MAALASTAALKYLSRLDDGRGEPADGRHVETRDRVRRVEEGDDELLAVAVLEVLREHGRGVGRRAELVARREREGALAD